MLGREATLEELVAVHELDLVTEIDAAARAAAAAAAGQARGAGGFGAYGDDDNDEDLEPYMGAIRRRCGAVCA